jgi:hypothetical protein
MKQARDHSGPFSFAVFDCGSAFPGKAHCLCAETNATQGDNKENLCEATMFKPWILLGTLLTLAACGVPLVPMV